jgi:hypothetical protein
MVHTKWHATTVVHNITKATINNSTGFKRTPNTYTTAQICSGREMFDVGCIINNCCRDRDQVDENPDLKTYPTFANTTAC